MLLTKLVMATSACISHWLAPGTSWARPTAPMRFGVWSSENAIHPGAALVGNDSLPALTGAPPAGLSPPDTLGVQSVAICPDPLGFDVGAPVATGGSEWFDLVDLCQLPLNTTIRVTTSAMTPSTARPAMINHGAFEPGPFGGGPGGEGPPGQPGGTCWPAWGYGWVGYGLAYWPGGGYG